MAPERAAPGTNRGALVLLAIALVWLALSIGLSPTAREPIQCGRDLEPDRDTVVMLSASWCGYCRRARDYLQSELIRHCEYDVETSVEGRRQFAAMSIRVVPVFRIRDDTLVGFSKTEIEQSMIAHGMADFDDD